MKKRIVVNIYASLLLEIVSVICGFVLPRLIMVNYGSEYNGIVSSVAQGLSIITLLRGGVGGVTRAALYKPLVEQDTLRISEILRATEMFMRRIAYIFAVFLLLFACVYPVFVREEFAYSYTASLILILGINTFVQYYFGISNQMLLQADQRQYVFSCLQIFAILLNTIVSVILINAGLEFRLVKLISSLVFCIVPVGLYFYTRRKYQIIRDARCDYSVLEQRWDAFAHQVAAFLHTNTDIVLLTCFSDLFQISIYTVYNMVTNGVRKLVNVCTSGIDAAIGKLLASNENGTLKRSMEIYEWIMHVMGMILFSCTALLIVPFVMIYTDGVKDANYFQPLLGFLMSLSQFIFCIRLPYQNVVEAAGQFKQTKNGAIIETALNIIVSVPLTILWGGVGAVIGTIVANSFRTIQYAYFASEKILKRSSGAVTKRMAVSGGIGLVMIGIWRIIDIESFLWNVDSYFTWMLHAGCVFLVVTILTIVANGAAYPELLCFIGKKTYRK